MRKRVLILILLIFLIGCEELIEESPTTVEETSETGDVIETPPEQDMEEREASEPAGSKEIPASYHIKDVPYYGELGFCYGSSGMMILKYNGFTEEQVQQYRTAVKAGQGGPPDMFSGFMEVDALEEFKVGYSKNYNQEYAEFYNGFLDSEQTVLFENKEQAFEMLKELISSDTPVIMLIHDGNHYVVAIGYDNQYVYTNDPGLDNKWTYKIDGGADLKERRIQVSDFFDEWTVSGQETEIKGGVGFPGDYGMIWRDEKTHEVDDEPDDDGEGCEKFDGNEEECLAHDACEWMEEDNLCEQIR